MACIKNEKSVFLSTIYFSLVHLLQIMKTSKIKDKKTLPNSTKLMFYFLFLRHYLESRNPL